MTLSSAAQEPWKVRLKEKVKIDQVELAPVSKYRDIVLKNLPTLRPHCCWRFFVLRLM